jgi:hypothetical protein
VSAGALGDDRSRAERVEAARQRVREHPAHEARATLEMLRVAIEEIFAPNGAELLGLLREASTNVELALELVQNVYRSVHAERFHAALAQRLHNYLAASFTVVEHTQTIMRTREKRLGGTDPLIAAFAEKKAEIAGIVEVALLRDLRRYMQHYAYLPLTHQVSIADPGNVSQSMVSEVTLHVPTLLEFQGWSASTKQFLLESSRVALRPACEVHFQKVLLLNRWFLRQLDLELQPLVSEYDELVVAANAVLTGLDLEQARRFTQEKTRQRRSTERRVWSGDPSPDQRRSQ